MSLLELFCHIDDFCQDFEKTWKSELLTSGLRQHQRDTSLSLSEMLTIMVYFHQSQYRYFKAYYTEHLQVYLKAEFPQLLSYNRFVQLIAQPYHPALCVFAALLWRLYRH